MSALRARTHGWSLTSAAIVGVAVLGAASPATGGIAGGLVAGPPQAVGSAASVGATASASVQPSAPGAAPDVLAQFILQHPPPGRAPSAHTYSAATSFVSRPPVTRPPGTRPPVTRPPVKAPAVTTPPSGGAGVAGAAAGACYGTAHTQSSALEHTLAVASFGLYYDCTVHVWTLAVVTSSTWTSDQLGRIVFYVDNDNNPATGCHGYDRAVIGTFGPDDGLSAASVITPSCDEASFRMVAPGTIDHPGADSLEMGFSNDDIGNPGSFHWSGALQPRSAASAEAFPATGNLAESGFPPVPADNPCPPGVLEGRRARVAVVADTASAPAAEAALRGAGMRSLQPLGGGVVRFTGDLDDATAALARAGIDGAVSTDRVARYADVPNDPLYPQQWNLPLIAMPAAWGVTHGSASVAVADIDSGVDSTHPQLQGKLLPGYDARSGVPLAAGNTDTVGHGTEVAGVIAAATNDATGIAGVGWDTKVAPVKLSDVPLTSEMVAGIRWATDHGYRVINVSVGGCGDPALATAVSYAQGRGVLVVAAAGNEFDDGNPVEYPAAYPGVVAVGATARDGSRATYSETGGDVGLVAPGGSGDAKPADDLLLLQAGGGYTTGAGTSFSSPEVAAVAALVLAANPTLSAADAGALVEATATHVGTSPDASYGHGLLNAGNALRAAARMRRVAGEDRYATAAAVSRLGYPNGARTVYVASGQTFTDALGTGALAGVDAGPVLLSEPCGLPSSAAAELARLRPTTVVVVGGTTALCQGVGAAIAKSTGVVPTRVAGIDRYATDAALVRRGWPAPVTVAYVTTGVNFPDGLAGSARAARDGAPLLLTDTCSLPAAVRAELVRLAPKVVRIIGGTGAVCAGVSDSIAALGARVERIAGATRVATAVALVADGWSSSPTALLASAANFPDALSAGALAGHLKVPLLISDACASDADVAAELAALKVTTITVLGGTRALCGGAVAPLAAALG